MNGMDTEFEIKKDIPNNAIFREPDPAQRYDFLRTIGIGGLAVGMLLFSAWQHFEVLRHGYLIEQLQQVRASEDMINRKLRLELEALRAPARIEFLAAADLHMVLPLPKDALVIERMTPATPDKAIIASVR